MSSGRRRACCRTIRTRVEGRGLLDQAFGGNRLTPIQIVILTGTENGVFQPEALAAIAQLTDDIKKDPRVEEVASLTNVVPDLTSQQIRALTPEFFKENPARGGSRAEGQSPGEE